RGGRRQPHRSGVEGQRADHPFTEDGSGPPPADQCAQRLTLAGCHFLGRARGEWPCARRRDVEACTMGTAPRIVRIDDNRDWLETLAEYLREKGYTVFTAADAPEGLACLARNEVALVVCDYHLPGMDGLELVRHLRKQQKDVAILLVSSEEEP